MVFAAVHWVGGWPLLHAFDALVWAGGLAVATRGRPRASTGGVFGAIGLAFPYASLRAQSFAVLAFGLVLAWGQVFNLSGRNGEVGNLSPRLMIPLLLVLWQNLHPSVSVTAVGAVGAFVAGSIAAKRDCRAVPWSEVGLAVAAGIAVVCTHAGRTVLAAAEKNAEICRALEVAEWLPAWTPANLRPAVPAAGP